MRSFTGTCASTAAIFVWATAADAQTVGTAFTYQGQLVDGGVPVDEVCDFVFTLWDDPTATDVAHRVGGPLRFDADSGTPPPVSVVLGVFTVVLDFGENVFQGDARWLGIAVRCPSTRGIGLFTTLSPRQEVRPVPYALALPAMRIEQAGPDPILGDCPGFLILRAPTVVGGWHGNRVERGALGATIAGGGGVECSGSAAEIREHPNVVTYNFCTVGGGRGNHAGQVDADGNILSPYATVSGGVDNTAKGQSSTVSGGSGNTASGVSATVGGGTDNTARGGWNTVSGGRDNRAATAWSTVPGGKDNLAGGQYSFAAGRRARVRESCTPDPIDCPFGAGDNFPPPHGDTDGDEGTSMWADSRDFDFISDGPNQFLVRATRGTSFVSAIDGDGNPSNGVRLDANAGAWGMLCDRDAKDNIKPVDGRAVLQRLTELPVATWNWISEAGGVRHMGPTAQDFHAAFGLGSDPKRIVTIDADGVALAAIQGLHEILVEIDAERCALQAEKDAEIARQNETIKNLTARLARVESILAGLAAP